MAQKNLFIVAGESSGDTRGAEIVARLKEIDPAYTFEGLGGEKLAREGVTILFDLPSIAVVGLTEVLKKYFLFRKIFYMALARVRKTRPAAVVLVDYPGFNLRFAKQVKKLNIPVIYYVSPQVWAWANWRVKKIARIVDKMLVILPFEVDIYKETSLDVEFVGHPLVDTFKPSDSPEAIRAELGVEKNDPVISILCGSRENEVERVLPVLITAAELLLKEKGNVHFVISKAPHLPRALYERHLKKTNIAYTLIERSIHDLIVAADFCWVTSGTATLETALGLTPYIITYKTSWLTYVLAKYLITIPYIGLANIIAGKKIIPEFLQYEAHPETIAHETRFLLDTPQARAQIIKELQAVKEKLGATGASERGAQAINRFLGGA
jgi:lipid-A-disaccharide synthase